MVGDVTTGEVVGALASGQTDFVLNTSYPGNCTVSNVCNETSGCPGFESVTKIKFALPCMCVLRVYVCACVYVCVLCFLEYL